ncbi:HEAT repeat domain-containing protein [Sphaerospermopsis aphanizomenoides BCCUSP55]|uniref:NACHT domain-containing protein n=1 Tax=Sphaerospermopsis aphanizomenoides TaxID=459663 RepID=UPI001904776C|nr:HEAT repeat domain-containing protein [Sphaerospermopsis aphanizomenoides]MBK1989935.1 HEAT repeat domain-containing protein [Sphaerospermopsis aphanizomenoides BCCUSP55]
MNYSAATTPEQQFLRWIGIQYGFTGDTYAVFLSRFNPENYSKANNVLAKSIQWNRDPADEKQTFGDNLKKIYNSLETDGCSLGDRGPGRKDIWKKAYKWLWETKFSEWKKTQNQVIPVQQVQQEAVCNFLNQIITDFQHIKLKLFHTTQPIILKDQYIPIQVTLERKYTHTIETTWSYAESEAEIKRAYSRKHLEESKPTQVNWPEAKKQHQRLMVLADPGMGKTTLLKREAYLTAQAALKSLEDNSQTLEDLVIPIFLRLSEIADATKKEVTAKVSDAILSLLESKYEKYFTDIKDFLTDKLKDGKCLLLLDALDEVPKEARNNLSKKLNTFIRNYDCSIICTSRIVGYSGAFLDKAKDVEIVPFNETQINQYIETWFKIAAEFINDDSVSAASLIRELQNKPQIRGLVQNPLLLSLICSLYQEKGINLPARRCEVYEKAVKYMLGKWSQNRQPQNEGRIKAKIRFLEQLAYNFSCAGKEIFSSDELYDQIEEYLQGDKVPTIFRNADTDKLITELSEEDGILQKLHESGEQYLFLHRTFQEYFTACYLQRLPDGIELAKAHFWDYEWHETLSLMAGLMENPIELLQRIKNEKDDIFNTLLLLAGRCVVESKQSDHQLVKNIIDDIHDFWQIYADFEFIKSVVVILGQTQVQMILNLQADLKHEYEDVRENAAYVLGKIGSEKAIDALTKASLEDNSEEAAEALEEIRSEKNVDPLIKDFNDADEDLTSNVDEPLEKIRSEKNVDALIQDLNDPKWDVRYSASVALGKTSSDKAVDALIKALADPEWCVRSSVAVALGKIASDKAVDPLTKTLEDDPEWCVRGDVAEALEKIGNLKTLSTLIQKPQMLNDDEQIFLLARKLAIRFSKEKVPFIPVYPELLGQSFDV